MKGAARSRAGSPDHFADRKIEREVETEVVIEEERPGDEAYTTEAVDSEDVFEFGRGLTNYNSLEIDRIKGLRR